MVKRTGPTNVYLRQTIEDLKKKSVENKAPIWGDVAEKLSNPTRQKVEVNISDIERNTKSGETILVPGIVLSNGKLTKQVKVAAWKFSPKAAEKIKQVHGETLTIEELVKKNPQGSGVKILV